MSPAAPAAATAPGASLLLLNRAWIDTGLSATEPVPGAATPASPPAAGEVLVAGSANPAPFQ